MRAKLNFIMQPNPIGGQGGNGAIESAAEFVNALLTIRDKRAGGLDGLTVGEIESISQQMQDARQERAKLIVKAAHSQQSLLAFENPALSTLVLRIIAPLSHEEDSLTRFAGTFNGAARLKSLPVPARPRIIPFNHELPAKPINSRITTAVRIALTVLLGFVLCVSTRKLGRSFDSFSNESGTSDGTMLSMWRTFPSFDIYNDTTSDTKTKFQLVYALSQLASPILIYTIEGYRRGNQGTLLALPSVLACAISYQGLGRVAIAYVILISWQSFQLPTGRKIPVEVARSMGPALVASGIGPLLLIFSTSQGTDKWEVLRFICTSFPLFFTLLVASYSLIRKRGEQAKIYGQKYNGTTKESVTPRDQVAPLKECYLPNDVPILQSLYLWIFYQQCLAHFALVAYGYLNLGLSLAAPFLVLPRSFTTLIAPSSAMGALEYDMTLASLGFLAQTVYSLWSLRYLGYVTTLAVVRAAIGVVAGYVFLGPSATLAGFWIWREGIFSHLSTYPY
jgi:hypothetical protein